MSARKLTYTLLLVNLGLTAVAFLVGLYLWDKPSQLFREGASDYNSKRRSDSDDRLDL